MAENGSSLVREIEVKYRVDDLEGIFAALKARGIEVSDPVHQDDQAYAPASWQFGDSKLGVSFLRLRTVAGRHCFTLKQPAQNEQACLEYETEVADRGAMHHAALHMGYRPAVRLTKTRRSVSCARGRGQPREGPGCFVMPASLTVPVAVSSADRRQVPVFV